MIEITLPFPPSVNACLKPSRGRLVHTDKAREYKRACRLLLKRTPEARIEGEVFVLFNFYMPDRRQRDINNYYKLVCDVLTDQNVIEDDSLIMHEFGSNCGVEKPGRVDIKILSLDKVAIDLVISEKGTSNIIPFPLIDE